MTDLASIPLQQEIGRDLQVSASFDVQQEIERRVAFLADLLTSTGLRSLVLGISGGVDSMTAGRLWQLAVERVRAAGRESTLLIEAYADFGNYQAWTEREIPVVILQPRQTAS